MIAALPIVLAALVSLGALAGATMAEPRRAARREAPPVRRRRRRKTKKKKRAAAPREEGQLPPVPPPPPPPAPDRPDDAEPSKKKDKPATKKDAAKLVPHKVPTKIEKTPKLKASAAAAKLYTYAAKQLAARRYSALGTRARPSTTIKTLQTAMRRLTADGIYGPKTRARGQELLGKTFPIRKRKRAAAPEPPPPPPPPVVDDEPDDEPAAAPLLVSTRPVVVEPRDTEPEAEPEEGRSAVDAATELLLYVQAIGTRGRAKALGYKGRPNDEIRDAQADMGDLTADGIYGRRTRDRGRALINKKFPAR